MTAVMSAPITTANLYAALSCLSKMAANPTAALPKVQASPTTTKSLSQPVAVKQSEGRELCAKEAYCVDMPPRHFQALPHVVDFGRVRADVDAQGIEGGRERVDRGGLGTDRVCLCPELIPLAFKLALLDDDLGLELTEFRDHCLDICDLDNWDFFSWDRQNS